MIVIDASVVVALLIKGEGMEVVERRLFASPEDFNAPHLIDAEVAHVLRRLAATDAVEPARGREAIADLGSLPLRRYAHDNLLPRVWELRHNLSAYDAFYVALSELLDAPLLTRDRRLSVAPGHNAHIELV